MMDGQKNSKLLNKKYFSVGREILLYCVSVSYRHERSEAKKHFLTEMCSRLRVGKICVTCLQLKWSEKKEMIYRHCFQT